MQNGQPPRKTYITKSEYNKNREFEQFFLSTKVITFLAENHPTKKTPGPDGFTGEFHITKKEMPIPIVHTHSWEPPATGYKRSDCKTRQKHLMAREIYTNSPHDCRCKILKKNQQIKFKNL